MGFERGVGGGWSEGCLSGFPGIQFFRLVDLVVVVVVPVLNERDARFVEDDTFDTAKRDALNGLDKIRQSSVKVNIH